MTDVHATSSVEAAKGKEKEEEKESEKERQKENYGLIIRNGKGKSVRAKEPLRLINYRRSGNFRTKLFSDSLKTPVANSRKYISDKIKFEIFRPRSIFGHFFFSFISVFLF